MSDTIAPDRGFYSTGNHRRADGIGTRPRSIPDRTEKRSGKLTLFRKTVILGGALVVMGFSTSGEQKRNRDG